MSKPAPLSLLTVEQALNREVLVASRRNHEPQFTTKAVRQRGRLTLPLNDRTYNRFVTQGATLRESLILHLATLSPSSTSSTSRHATSGISRQVRHTGTFVEALGASGETTQAKNKVTVRMASAKVRSYSAWY